MAGRDVILEPVDREILPLSRNDAGTWWRELTGLPFREVVSALMSGASLRCAIPSCQKRAYKLDHYWPYHEEMNRCRDHVGAFGPERG